MRETKHTSSIPYKTPHRRNLMMSVFSQNKEQHMKKIYYAHNMLQYGSNIEAQDIGTLEILGFEIINPNHPDNEAAYFNRKKEAPGTEFTVFTDLVKGCEGIAFRSIMGRISAGVGKEIRFAKELGLPIIEMPTITTDRFLTVEETIEYCRPLGINEA